MPDGAVQLTLTCLVPPTPVTALGGDGTLPTAAAVVVTAPLAAETTLDPAALVATTLKV